MNNTDVEEDENGSVVKCQHAISFYDTVYV